MPKSSLLLSLMILLTELHAVRADEVPEFKWRAVEIDQIEIGYGLQLTDVDGDGKTDIVLADKSTIQWYESPHWTKHVIAKNLTERDNVCVAAKDIDGDGKCEIAVGGQWNPTESVKDGAVFYLHPPTDRRQPWTPIKLHHEPSIHRMHWVKGKANQYRLTVKPLRGRGTVDGNGAGVRVLEYTRPEDPTAEWKYDLVCDSLHLAHNFHPINWDDDEEEELIFAAREGILHVDRQDGQWVSTQLTEHAAGEIRDGKLPGGSKSAVYVQPDAAGELWQTIKVLDEAIKDGHALACADFLGVGSDQVLVGWRAMGAPGVPGIKLFTPLDEDGSQWRQTQVSAEAVAVEDFKVGDLNDDGKIDIVAAGRQTKNLVIFFNEG
jgi:FG-GAP-like repeat